LDEAAFDEARHGVPPNGVGVILSGNEAGVAAHGRIPPLFLREAGYAALLPPYEILSTAPSKKKGTFDAVFAFGPLGAECLDDFHQFNPSGERVFVLPRVRDAAFCDQ